MTTPTTQAELLERLQELDPIHEHEEEQRLLLSRDSATGTWTAAIEVVRTFSAEGPTAAAAMEAAHELLCDVDRDFDAGIELLGLREV